MVSLIDRYLSIQPVTEGCVRKSQIGTWMRLIISWCYCAPLVIFIFSNKMPFDLQKVIRPNILALTPYRCARDDYNAGILLDANENAYGPSLPEQLEGDLNRYPDPYHVKVKERLLKLRKVPSINNLFLGVGSDEVIDLIMRISCVPGKDKILITPPTYGMYSVCAQINDVQVVKSYLDVQDSAFQLRVDDVFFLSMNRTPTGVLRNNNNDPFCRYCLASRQTQKSRLSSSARQETLLAHVSATRISRQSWNPTLEVSW